MNTPSEQDQMDKLWELVGEDPRLEHIAVDLQLGTGTISIGGQSPFWQHHIERERLTSGDLRAYAKEIVDVWQARRGTV